MPRIARRAATIAVAASAAATAAVAISFHAEHTAAPIARTLSRTRATRTSPLGEYSNGGFGGGSPGVDPGVTPGGGGTATGGAAGGADLAAPSGDAGSEVADPARRRAVPRS